MLKFLTVVLLMVAPFDGVAVIGSPIENNYTYKELATKSNSQWIPHILDFVQLIDIDKLTEIAFKYLDDPEVFKFMTFVFSPKFKEIIWEFESMAEFKQASAYLTAKGYDIYELVNIINAALNLPPYEANELMRSKNGLSGLFEDLIEVLPLEDMKKLFEEKLQNNAEIATLFETINSEEFLNILRRMSHNPKFIEIKVIFESYGFDFKLLCNMAQEIFGDYYQGVFCY